MDLEYIRKEYEGLFAALEIFSECHSKNGGCCLEECSLKKEAEDHYDLCLNFMEINLVMRHKKNRSKSMLGSFDAETTQLRARNL